jgi:PAS domain S-box-containing protein
MVLAQTQAGVRDSRNMDHLSEQLEGANRRLLEMEERWQATYKATDSAIVILGPEGRLKCCNPAFERLAEESEEACVGKSLLDWTEESDWQNHNRYFSELLEGKRSRYELEKRFLAASGRPVWVVCTVSGISNDGKLRSIVGVLSHSQQRRLEKLVDFEDNARRLIGAEIHDLISQPLAALYFLLQVVLDQGDTLEVRQSLELCRNLIDQSKNLMFELRNSKRHGTGTIRALREFFEDFSAQTGVRVYGILPPSGVELTGLSGRFLFRIIVEAMRNAARHGSPSHVDVAVKIEDGMIIGSVADDGSGSARRRLMPGQGINGMKLRAELLGGDLRLVAGDGVRVEFSLPLNESD